MLHWYCQQGRGKIMQKHNFGKISLRKFVLLAWVHMTILCPYDQLFCLRYQFWVNSEAGESGNCDERRALAGVKLSLKRLLAGGIRMACVSRRLVIHDSQLSSRRGQSSFPLLIPSCPLVELLHTSLSLADVSNECPPSSLSPFSASCKPGSGLSKPTIETVICRWQ